MAIQRSNKHKMRIVIRCLPDFRLDQRRGLWTIAAMAERTAEFNAGQASTTAAKSSSISTEEDAAAFLPVQVLLRWCKLVLTPA
jgi:hypothetical protein